MEEHQVQPATTSQINAKNGPAATEQCQQNQPIDPHSQTMPPNTPTDSNNQQGSTDTIDNSPTFNPFPKLPIEVRFKIWGLTFEKQHVDLDIQRFRAAQSALKTSPVRPVFPATMHVNQESLQETLRKYTVSVPGSTRAVRATSTRLPVCINFSIDSCTFSMDFIGMEKYWSSYKTWLSKLDGQDGKLKSLKELEIRD